MSNLERLMQVIWIQIAPMNAPNQIIWIQIESMNAPNTDSIMQSSQPRCTSIVCENMPIFPSADHHNIQTENFGPVSNRTIHYRLKNLNVSQAHRSHQLMHQTVSHSASVQPSSARTCIHEHEYILCKHMHATESLKRSLPNHATTI